MAKNAQSIMNYAQIPHIIDQWLRVETSCSSVRSRRPGHRMNILLPLLSIMAKLLGVALGFLSQPFTHLSQLLFLAGPVWVNNGQVITPELSNSIQETLDIWNITGLYGEPEFHSWGNMTEDGDETTEDVQTASYDYEHGRNVTPLPPTLSEFNWHTLPHRGELFADSHHRLEMLLLASALLAWRSSVGSGARGSAMTVIPFNQGSKQYVKALIDYIYATLGLNLDYILPSAAVLEDGREMDGLDETLKNKKTFLVTLSRDQRRSCWQRQSLFRIQDISGNLALELVCLAGALIRHIFFSPRALGSNFSVAILSLSILAFTLDLPISHYLEIPLDPISLTKLCPSLCARLASISPSILRMQYPTTSLVISRYSDPRTHSVFLQLEAPQYKLALARIDALLTEFNRLDDKMILTEVHLRLRERLGLVTSRWIRLNAIARPKAESLSATWKGTSATGGNTKNFTGGAFFDSKTSQWHDVLDPSTQTLLTRVSETTMEEFDQAVDAASQAFKLQYQIRQNADALAHSIVLMYYDPWRMSRPHLDPTMGTVLKSRSKWSPSLINLPIAIKRLLRHPRICVLAFRIKESHREIESFLALFGINDDRIVLLASMMVKWRDLRRRQDILFWELLEERVRLPILENKRHRCLSDTCSMGLVGDNQCEEGDLDSDPEADSDDDGESAISDL
ncbi:uncharacterized protein HD556DRAFT_1311087 [Suillus plorans]|uniref:Uncharacterized protein n=1 Tax=Suillus plorans TaxID=116603 RepID=A0A9P7AHN1_9AGAM|nr:uncharacterized protein HD556DRAFT_1311087 [Suillus plorans]KAG1789685.1 hypothetical protein HD556DRAFT_1311087 [Suillus plorans]